MGKSGLSALMYEGLTFRDCGFAESRIHYISERYRSRGSECQARAWKQVFDSIRTEPSLKGVGSCTPLLMKRRLP